MLTEKPKLNIDAVFTLNVGNTHTKLIHWQNGAAGERIEWITGEKNPKWNALFRADSAADVVVAGVVPAYQEKLAAKIRKSGRSVLFFRRDLKPRIKIVPSPAVRVGDARIAG